MSKETSEFIAQLAAKGLRDPSHLTTGEVRKICGSALAQAEQEMELPPPVLSTWSWECLALGVFAGAVAILLVIAMLYPTTLCGAY